MKLHEMFVGMKGHKKLKENRERLAKLKARTRMSEADIEEAVKKSTKDSDTCPKCGSKMKSGYRGSQAVKKCGNCGHEVKGKFADVGRGDAGDIDEASPTGKAGSVYDNILMGIAKFAKQHGRMTRNGTKVGMRYGHDQFNRIADQLGIKWNGEGPLTKALRSLQAELQNITLTRQNIKKHADAIYAALPQNESVTEADDGLHIGESTAVEGMGCSKKKKTEESSPSEIAQHFTYNDGEDIQGPIDAHGVKGMQSRPWRRKFKNVNALWAWVDKMGGDVEVLGYRPLEESTADIAYDKGLEESGLWDLGKKANAGKAQKKYRKIADEGMGCSKKKKTEEARGIEGMARKFVPGYGKAKARKRADDYGFSGHLDKEYAKYHGDDDAARDARIAFKAQKKYRKIADEGMADMDVQVTSVGKRGDGIDPTNKVIVQHIDGGKRYYYERGSKALERVLRNIRQGAPYHVVSDDYKNITDEAIVKTDPARYPEHEYMDDETGQLYRDKEDLDSWTKDSEPRQSKRYKTLNYDAFTKGAKIRDQGKIDKWAIIGDFGDVAAGGGDPTDYVMNKYGVTIDDVDSVAQSQGYENADDWAQSYLNMEQSEFAGVKMNTLESKVNLKKLAQLIDEGRNPATIKGLEKAAKLVEMDAMAIVDAACNKYLGAKTYKEYAAVVSLKESLNRLMEAAASFQIDDPAGPAGAKDEPLAWSGSSEWAGKARTHGINRGGSKARAEMGDTKKAQDLQAAWKELLPKLKRVQHSPAMQKKVIAAIEKMANIAKSNGVELSPSPSEVMPKLTGHSTLGLGQM